MAAMAYERIHMIGIGGIGLSALARLYRAWGYRVSGSDLKRSEITDALRAEGIAESAETGLFELIKRTDRPGMRRIASPRPWMRSCIANKDLDEPRRFVALYRATKDPTATQAAQPATPGPMPPWCTRCGVCDDLPPSFPIESPIHRIVNGRHCRDCHPDHQPGRTCPDPTCTVEPRAEAS